MKTDYPYTIETDEDGFLIVQFIDLEDTFTQGKNLEDAAFNASEVLSGMLSCKLEEMEEIPKPSICPKNAYTATPEPEIQAAILLNWAANEKNQKITKCKGKYPTLKQLNKAAKSIGKQLVLSIE